MTDAGSESRQTSKRTFRQFGASERLHEQWRSEIVIMTLIFMKLQNNWSEIFPERNMLFLIFEQDNAPSRRAHESHALCRSHPAVTVDIKQSSPIQMLFVIQEQVYKA